MSDTLPPVYEPPTDLEVLDGPEVIDADGTDGAVDPAARPQRSYALSHLTTRVIVVVAAVLGAYHYSLTTLIRTLGVDSPLAYLGLIPFIAFGICFYTARPTAGEPEVHDRYLDRIIGIPLVVIPVLVLLILPTQMSTYFWVWRIDLLTLPMFTAGCIALVLGTRTLLRVRVGILWLFAAWPVPYQFVLQHFLEPFTAFTVRSLRWATGFTSVATMTGGAEGSFRVMGPEKSFVVVVASACSGANSLVGFLIVAGALAMLSGGTRRSKVLWVAAGSALVWAFNIARIMTIFVVGSLWGERTAIDGFHPYIGLVFFSVAMTTMVLLAPRFGVRLGRPDRSPVTFSKSVDRGAPKWMAAGAIVLVLAAITGTLDDQLRTVDPIAGALGTPRLGTFEQTTLHMNGFQGVKMDHFDWTQRFFGEDSDWTRYKFDGPGSTVLAATIPILADVVTTSDVQTFSDFGVEACYRFHGYDVKNNQRVDLGNGVTGNVLTWKDPASPTTWSSVYWHWPVKTKSGIRYQRIVLMFNSNAGAQVAAPKPNSNLATSLGIGLDAILNNVDAQPTDQKIATKAATGATVDEARLFIVSFAQQMVRDSAANSADLAAQKGSN